MRVQLLIYLIAFMLSIGLTGCSNTKDNGDTKNNATNEPTNTIAKEQDISITPTAVDEVKEDNSNTTNTSEPFVGSKDLDSETEDFFYGTWKVEELLGFANSWNDASEYPTGQNIVDDEIIINQDFFSSKGLENYTVYQHELKNPLYKITEICYNKDSFYRVFKIDLPSLNINDEVKAIRVSNSSTELAIPVSFLVVNNERLILVLEATIFELKRVTD